MSTHNYEELAALHAIARSLAQPWDLRDQLEQVLSEMNTRLGMQRGMISLLDRDTGEAWLEVAHGINLDGVEISYRAGEGITGKVAQSGRPMVIPNLGQEARFLDRTGARTEMDGASPSAAGLAGAPPPPGAMLDPPEYVWPFNSLITINTSAAVTKPFPSTS